MNLRNDLFNGWAGCSNGDCVVRDNSKGMHTNGSCKCVVEANRAQLSILQSRINRLIQQPAPLVKLTDDSLISIYLTCKAEWKATNKRERERIAVLFGHAIMDAMERVNGGQR